MNLHSAHCSVSRANHHRPVTSVVTLCDYWGSRGRKIGDISNTTGHCFQTRSTPTGNLKDSKGENGIAKFPRRTLSFSSCSPTGFFLDSLSFCSLVPCSYGSPNCRLTRISRPTDPMVWVSIFSIVPGRRFNISLHSSLPALPRVNPISPFSLLVLVLVPLYHFLPLSSLICPFCPFLLFFLLLRF